MDQTITVQLVPMDFTSERLEADLAIFAAFVGAMALVWGLKWLVNYLLQGGSDV